MTLARESRGLQHDGIFYDDESTLAAAAVSFVEDGIARDEMVIVNSAAHPVTSLLRALFSGEDRVCFGDGAVYATPAGALDAYRRTLQRGLAEGAQGFRAMGFIDLAASNLPWQEWLRYEAAVNHVFDDYPLRSLCPYDTTAVPRDVIDAIASAHQGIVDHTGRRSNPSYVAPAELLTADDLRTPPHPVQAMAPRMVLESDGDPEDLRMELYAATMFTELPRLQVDDFVSGVTEVVSNAHRHGEEPVRLRLWAADSAVVCTVTDHGPGIGDPLVGYARPTDPARGLGLWGVRQLVDLLDFEHTAEGFTVRVASFA